MVPVSTEDAASKRPKKACTQCRQQKARCDAHLQQEDGPCSRCRRLGLDCVIVDTFEREHKRRKLYQLQNETQQLRERLRGSSGDQQHASTSPSEKDHSQQQVSTVRPTDTHSPTVSHTLPRMLDGTTLESDEIDQLFRIFFHDYSWSLPILDSSTSPNDYYHASPGLFWAIVGVAARKYDPNPELLRILPSKIVDLILSTRTKISIFSIQALLLVLTWQFPRSIKALEPTFLMHGTLLHMCMHVGLHTPSFSQEFSKDKLELTTDEISNRAALWANCVLGYQRSCAMKGSPCMPLSDITMDPNQRQKLMALVSTDLQYQLKAQDVVIDCTNALAKNGLQSMSKDQEHAMEAVVLKYLDRLEQLPMSPSYSPASAYAKSVSRLIIQAFYFFQDPRQWASNTAVISDMLSDALKVIDIVTKSGGHPHTSLTWYSLHGLLHANCVLLRIYKTPSTTHLSHGQETVRILQIGIDLLKGMSIDPLDLPSRSADVFVQLLSSTKVFVHPDSLPGHPQVVPLRIRSRLGMCNLLDVWVWWREEFEGYTGLYPTPLKKIRPQATSADIPESREYLANGAQPTLNNAVPYNPEVGSFGNANPSYQSNPTPDALPISAPDPFMPDDIFTDIWTYWPDENWGIPGLS